MSFCPNSCRSFDTPFEVDVHAYIAVYNMFMTYLFRQGQYIKDIHEYFSSFEYVHFIVLYFVKLC